MSAESRGKQHLRQRLGLDPGDPCPSPDAFAYAEKVMPRKGYLEIDDDDGTGGYG